MQALNLRDAEHADCAELWNWRNDPVTRRMSGNTDEVPWQEHEVWFDRSLSLPTRQIWIVETGIEKCGMVRFDKIEDEPAAWEISIALNPRFRGQGLGEQVLSTACDIFFKRQGKSALIAKVRHVNGASLRIFESCGFWRSALDDNFVELRRHSTG